jgi:hypothetical protein
MALTQGVQSASLLPAILAVAALVRRVNRRCIAWCGLLLMVGANVVRPLIRGFEVFTATRT